MELFSDPQYDSMDFISQAIEPFETTLLSDFMTIPDEIVLENKDIQKMLKYTSYVRLDLENLIMYALCNKLNIRSSFSDNLSSNLHVLFNKFSSEEVFFEIATDKLSQCEFTHVREHLSNLNFTITINKVQNNLSKEYLLNHFVQIISNNLLKTYSRTNDFNSRLREIKALFNVEKNVKYDNSTTQLRRMICDLVQHDKLKIRSEALIFKLSNWISEYTNKNDSAALVNLTKLKILSHNNRAIYSINEAI